MKKIFLGVATFALLFAGAQTASAAPRFSVGFGPGGAGVSYGTRVGNNGFLSVGYGSGYYGGYGYGGYGGYGNRYYGYPGYGVQPRYYGGGYYAPRTGYYAPRTGYYPNSGYRFGRRGW